MLVAEISNSGAQITPIKYDCSFEEELEVVFSLISDKNDIVVLDGYRYDERYQRAIKSREIKLVCIDDIHSYHFVSDVVINHAGGISNKSYSIEPYTRLCLGPSYVLLREPFLKSRLPHSMSGNILICMGGSDPQNETQKILLDLLGSNGAENIHIVLGGGYKFLYPLRDMIEQNGASDKVFLYQMLDASKLADLMAICPVAVTPPSTVAFEYLSVGGILYLHQIAENQRDVKRYFINSGLAFDYIDFPITDNELLRSVSENTKKLFDRKSASRLVDVFNSI